MASAPALHVSMFRISRVRHDRQEIMVAAGAPWWPIDSEIMEIRNCNASDPER